MIPRCFALVAVALSSIHFAEALPVSSPELQSLADLPTPVDVGLPTSLPIPTESIPNNVPITNSLLLPTLTDTTVPVWQTSVPIPGLSDGILGSVGSISGADLPLNQDPVGKLGDLSDSAEGSGLLLRSLLDGVLEGLDPENLVNLQGHGEGGSDVGNVVHPGGHGGGDLSL